MVPGSIMPAFTWLFVNKNPADPSSVPIPTIDARALVAYLQTLGAGREVYDPALNGGKGGWRPWLKLQDAVTNQTMSEDTVHRAKVPIIVPGGSTASSSVMYQ
jgi:hypothetical protein